MEIFRRIHAEQGLTIMMVTHARNLIAYGTRHLEMADGTVREDSGARGEQRRCVIAGRVPVPMLNVQWGTGLSAVFRSARNGSE